MDLCERVAQLPPEVCRYVPVALAVVLVIFATGVVLNGKKTTAAQEVPVARRSAPPSVVLVGAEQSGKTSILLRAALGAVPPTATSQRENSALVSVGASEKRQVSLVDMPGHPRLRSGIAERLATADAVVICIDSSVASRGGGTAGALSALKQTNFHDALAESVECVSTANQFVARYAHAHCAAGAPGVTLRTIHTY